MVVRVDLYVTLLLQTFGANKDISPNNESVFCEVALTQWARDGKISPMNNVYTYDSMSGVYDNTSSSDGADIRLTESDYF